MLLHAAALCDTVITAFTSCFYVISRGLRSRIRVIVECGLTSVLYVFIVALSVVHSCSEVCGVVASARGLHSV